MTKKFNLYFVVDTPSYYYAMTRIYTTKKLKECTRISSIQSLCKRGQRLFKLTNTPKVQPRTIVLNEGRNILRFKCDIGISDLGKCYTVYFSDEEAGVNLFEGDDNVIIKKLGLDKLNSGEMVTLQFRVLKP